MKPTEPILSLLACVWRVKGEIHLGPAAQATEQQVGAPDQNCATENCGTPMDSNAPILSLLTSAWGVKGEVRLDSLSPRTQHAVGAADSAAVSVGVPYLGNHGCPGLRVRVSLRRTAEE